MGHDLIPKSVTTFLKGMNEIYPDEDWHVFVGRDVGMSSEFDEDYRRLHLRIKYAFDFIVMAD